MMRPIRSVWTQFLTTLVTRFEFGTISVARSNVSISVARALILRTNPCSAPTTTRSPTRMLRSHNRIRPETKLLAIDCRPKPMPTDSAPATMASFCTSSPICAPASRTATATPT